jgi:hypothetical protein
MLIAVIATRAAAMRRDRHPRSGHET